MPTTVTQQHEILSFGLLLIFETFLIRESSKKEKTYENKIAKIEMISIVI